MTMPPIIPGPQQQPPMTLAGMMPVPPKAKVHPASIVLAIIGGTALLCGGFLGIGAIASGSAAARPSPSPIYIYTHTAAAAEPVAPVAAAPSTSSAPPAAPAPPPAAATIKDGKWTVGVDFPPGTYRTTAEVSSGCYWEITKSGTNGSSIGDIVANDLPGGGRPSVTLEVGQDFKTGRCGTWALVG